MSDILVSIPGVEGESTLTGFERQIECDSLRHAIDLPVVSTGATRTEGASQHGPVELSHAVDSASPSLRLAVAAGTNLGKVTITRMQTLSGQSRPSEIIELGNAYATRVDTDTPYDSTTNMPGEEPIELFALEYSDIRWSYKYYVDGVERGSVQTAWSPAMQTTEVAA